MICRDVVFTAPVMVISTGEVGWVKVNSPTNCLPAVVPPIVILKVAVVTVGSVVSALRVIVARGHC